MNTTQNHNGLSKSSQDNIDLDKLQTVIKKSWIWVILIFTITLSSAYFTIRWTKPLYESESELKLDVKSDASELGFKGFNDNNINVISSEIELLKSKLFINKVIETVDLSISYYTAGQFLNDEKYKASPIKAAYEIKDNRILDKRIYITFVDSESFKISFNGEDQYLKQDFKFGELISTSEINLVITKTQHYVEEGDRNYFIIFNSNASLVNYFNKNLTVEPLNLNANIIKIALKDHNQFKAFDLVNAIDTIYLNYTQEEKNKENYQKIEWLNKELSDIEKQLEGYENYFENFTIDNRTSNLDDDLQKTIESINALDSQRYDISMRLNRTDELLENLKNDEGSLLLEVNPNQLPQYLNQSIKELYDLMEERNQLELSYNEATFALTKIENEISTLKDRLISQLSANKEKLQEQIKDLIYRKRKLEENFVKIPGKSTEFKKNQRFFELYEEFYLSLMQSKAQYQIAMAGTTTEFKILSTATVPSNPISPNKLIIMGIGGVSGFVLSFFFITISYLLHNKISSVHEIERITSAPILGSIPSANQNQDYSRLIVDQSPKSAVSESLRTIRTNIEFMIANDSHRVISVTSTIGGEGKTFFAVNFAGIVSLSNKKVLIIDLDMRKARVHRSFGHSSSEKGVSTILINKTTIEESIVETSVPNLHYIPAGPTPPNPSELILNNEFDVMLKNLKAHYDLIILDTPPVGLVTDGVLAMKKADLAVYIVRANYSKKIFLNTLNRLINVNQFKNLAVILNGATLSGSKSYGYGYYEEKPTSRKSIKRMVQKRV